MKARCPWRRHLVCALLLFAALPSCLFAQQKDRSPFRPDPLRFADGVLYTWSAPARWQARDWVVLGGLVAGTSALTLLDEPVRDFWQGQNNRFMSGVERIGYHYGKPYSAFAFTGGFYLTGVIFRNEWARETGLMLGTTLLSSGTIMG